MIAGSNPVATAKSKAEEPTKAVVFVFYVKFAHDKPYAS